MAPGRKHLASNSWEAVKKFFSNSANVLFLLKKLKGEIEENTISAYHLAQAIEVFKGIDRDELGMGKQSQPLLYLFDFIDAAITYGLLVKEVFKESLP